MAQAYLNGRFLPLEEACVPVLDRGFVFGDGVYEMIPAYGGRPFRLPQHLARLRRSLEAVRIPEPMDAAGWTDLLERLVAANGGGDQALYVQVTRGVARRDHAMPAGLAPTVFAMSSPLEPPSPGLLEEGVAAVTREDIRWRLCHVKSTSLLANVLLRQAALDAGAQEAILLRDGHLTEGAASNVFAVLAGAVHTPPKSEELLPGITRDLVLELAREAGLPVHEAPVSAARLEAAEEIWLSSSTRELLPVTRLDGRPVGGGRPGPLWRRVHAAYQALKQRHREGA